jgi:hypothetical protein
MEPTLSSASLKDIINELGRRANIKPAQSIADGFDKNAREGGDTTTSETCEVGSKLVDPTKALGCALIVFASPNAPTEPGQRPSFYTVATMMGDGDMGFDLARELLGAYMRDRHMAALAAAEREEEAKQAKMDKLLGVPDDTTPKKEG